MFRIEAYVEDKRLAEALRALAGIVRGQPAVQPVANIEEASGPKAASNGTSLAMFEKYVRSLKWNAPLTPQDLRDWLKANGKSPASASSLAVAAIKAHLIKRSGKGTASRYHVIKKG